MGYESIARNKKVAMFSPKMIDSKHWLDSPASYKKYNFFTVKTASYKEIKEFLIT